MGFYKLFEQDYSLYNYLENFRIPNKKNKECYIKDGYNIEQLTHAFSKHIIKSSLEDEEINPKIRFGLKKIILSTKNIFENNGIKNSVITHGTVEYHRYINGNFMPFTLHYDDFGGVDYTVNTAIYYLTKTVEGGDLEIYNDDDEKLIETIDVKPNPGKIKIVLMEGNVLHNVNQITSEGIRECVVVQLKCLR